MTTLRQEHHPLTRYVLIAFWGFQFGGAAFSPEWTWRPFWLVVSAVMVCGLIAYAYRQGKREAAVTR